MLPDESSAGLAMAAGLAAAMAGAEGPRYVEAPDGTRILFFERSNISHDEGRDVARIVFSGCFPSTATCSSTDEANPWKAASRRCSTVRATR